MKPSCASQKQIYVTKTNLRRKSICAIQITTQKSLQSISMLFMYTNGVRQTKYTVLKVFLRVFNPFLFIRGLPCPAVLTQNCRRLTIPGFLITVFLSLMVTLACLNQASECLLLLPSANSSRNSIGGRARIAARYRGLRQMVS
jgi:hypothetical protein